MTFDQLYKKHYVQIYRFCYRYTGDGDRAGDITQETFMKLYIRMKDRGKDIENPRAWLYRVAGNLCLNTVRTAKRREEITNDLVVEEHEKWNPESILLEKERSNLLRHSMQELRPEHKMLVLMYGDGMSYEEMANATGIPVNSIGKTLWRTIEKIAKVIKKQ